jgi:thiopurine S-methyltransferase
MEQSFWHARWRDGQIGFHEGRTNAHLLKHWDEVGAPSGGRVLVPLCGKSLDMLHLQALGHTVVGVELSPMACEAFFVENELSCERGVQGSFMAFKGTGAAAGITLMCGDFFLLDQDTGGLFDAFYDRASMIALPPHMRDAHAATLSAVVRPGGRGLLTTISYPPDEKRGPPFPVTIDEVKQRLLDNFGVQHIGTSAASDDAGKRWNLSWLKEHQVILTRREG